MGSVWRARDGGPGGPRVALKTVLTTKRSTQKLARLFQEEARISGSVRHPNLLEILDAGEDDGVPFLAMEWVEGVTLRRLAERPERVPLPLLLRSDIRADTDKLVFTGKVAKTNCCSEALNLDLVRISNNTQGCK